jgi:hypothetical protein
VLVDFTGRRFYFFFIQLWPQEVYFITGLLVMGALALFLVTALFGRLWCGYSCPQTVWTDLFIAVERLFEGDRNARMKLDKSPMSFDKFWRKGGKHAVWLGIAFSTGGAWIFYFHDAPTLIRTFWVGAAPLTAYIFLRPADGDHLRLRRHDARAGLHLHVPLAAHPGRHARRALPAGHLSARPGRAPRAAQEGRVLGRPRRLRRLQPVRRGLPDGHRHPQRLAAGVHQLRSVRRRLRRDHGQDGPAQGPDRLRHRPCRGGQGRRAASRSYKPDPRRGRSTTPWRSAWSAP